MAPYVKTSPSQVSTYKMCPRRWYFGSILKLPQGPQSPEATEGDRMHKQRENWQQYGIPPKHPSVTMTTSWTAPPRTENILIEVKTTELELDVGDSKVAVNGRVDFTDATDPLHITVLDWKSKGHLKDFRVKTPSLRVKKIAAAAIALETDEQLCFYGAWAFVKYPDAVDVVLGHGYMVRDEVNPDAELITTRPLPKTHVDGVIASIVPTLEAMKMDAQATRAEDVAIDTTACWAFGQRCPFYSNCTRPEQSFGSMFGEPENDVTLLETLRLSPGASEIPDPAKFVGVASSTPVPMPAEVTVATSESLADRLRAMAIAEVAGE